MVARPVKTRVKVSSTYPIGMTVRGQKILPMQSPIEPEKRSLDCAMHRYRARPRAVRGLGDSSGFTMELQNRAGMSREEFVAARDQLLAMANDNPKLMSVRLSDLPDVATLNIDIDTQRLTAYGINNSDANSTLVTAWGGRYVNDFIDKGA